MFFHLLLIYNLTVDERKKCDGNKPVCHSCEKRGINCDFPANIRIFHYQEKKENESVSKSTSSKRIDKSEIDSKPLTFLKQPEMMHPSCVINDRPKGIVDNQAKESLISLSERIEQILEEKEESDSLNSRLLQSRSDSMASLVSDSDNDSISTSFNQPPTPPSFSFKLSESQRATNLIHEGGSINRILDQMTIELIKKSINNLQYIDFEKKQSRLSSFNFVKSDYEEEEEGEEEEDITPFKHHNSLGYLEEVVPDEIIFQPDEYLSFD